jgi:hypothetical protein
METAELQAALDQALANANYRSSNSASKAILFAEAVSKLQLLRPQGVSHGGAGGESIQFSPAALAKQEQQALEFAAAAALTGGTGFSYLDTSCRNEELGQV